MRAIAACFGSVSGASRYHQSWPRLRARYASALMANKEFWALVVIVFLFAFAVSEAIAYLEKRVEYYAANR